MWHGTRLYWSTCVGLRTFTSNTLVRGRSNGVAFGCGLLRRRAMCLTRCDFMRFSSTDTAPAPSEDEVRQAYRVLGVHTTSSQAEVKKRYLALAKEHHPDVATGTNAAANTSRMTDINNAYQTVNRFHKSGQSLAEQSSTSSSSYYYSPPQDNPFQFYNSGKDWASGQGAPYRGAVYEPWYEEIDPMMYEMMWEEMRQRGAASMAAAEKEAAAANSNDDEYDDEDDSEDSGYYYEYVTRGSPPHMGRMPRSNRHSNGYDNYNGMPYNKGRVRWERRQGHRIRTPYEHNSPYNANRNTSKGNTTSSSSRAESINSKDATPPSQTASSETPSTKPQSSATQEQTSSSHNEATNANNATTTGWSDEDRQAMLHMYRDGKSFEFIANALSKTTTTVTEEFNRWCVRGSSGANNNYHDGRPSSSQAAEQQKSSRRRVWQSAAAGGAMNKKAKPYTNGKYKNNKYARPYPRSYPYYTESPDEIPPELYAAMAADMDAYDIRRDNYYTEDDDDDEEDDEDDEHDPYGYAMSEGGGYVPYSDAMPYNGHHFMSGQSTGKLYHEHKRNNNNYYNNGNNGFRGGRKSRHASQYGSQSFRPRYQDGNRRRR